MTVTWYKRDRLTKKEYYLTELNKLLLKSILADELLTRNQKLFAYAQFLAYKKTTSISYYRRYCLVNFNGRAVFQHFKLHRLVCKKWASKGLLIGMRKASF